MVEFFFKRPRNFTQADEGRGVNLAHRVGFPTLGMPPSEVLSRSSGHVICELTVLFLTTWRHFWRLTRGYWRSRCPHEFVLFVVGDWCILGVGFSLNNQSWHWDIPGGCGVFPSFLWMKLCPVKLELCSWDTRAAYNTVDATWKL